ncbi:thioesterase [Paenibacillus swuensis]|uniref:Thioesterase n=1 Tax=Paenibacillus swuensis TaxID=1178515 RepID=A0A172TL56_9BACL|nr:PaaI family thioesterase [Paenibacillus swuensis]ANE47760.1 thioesterase [Paenibacillus swuensis]
MNTKDEINEDVTPEVRQYIERLESKAKHTFWGTLGCRLDHLDARKVTVSLDAEERHLNLIGIVHGGVLSSLLDNAMGVLVMSARPKNSSVTTNLNVHFMHPLKEGRLLVTAELLHETNSILTVYGEIRDEAGQLGTMGTGSFRILNSS